MRYWSLVVPIQPVAWQRVKQARSGHSYVPQKTAKFKAELARIAKASAPINLMVGPIAILLVFYVPRPKRPKFSEPSVRPDLDNYIKGVLDALNGIVWIDDGQITSIEATKKYAPNEPQILISVQQTE